MRARLSIFTWLSIAALAYALAFFGYVRTLPSDETTFAYAACYLTIAIAAIACALNWTADGPEGKRRGQRNAARIVSMSLVILDLVALTAMALSLDG